MGFKPSFKNSSFCRGRNLVVIGLSVIVLAGCSGAKSWDAALSDGRIALANHDYEKAEKSFQAAIKAAQDKYGANAGQTATCMTELAEMYQAQGEYRKAAPIFKDLVPIYDKIEPDSADDKRVRDEYKMVKKKIKKYKLEPVEDDASKTDAAKTDGAKPDAGKSDSDLTDSKNGKDGKKAPGSSKEEVKDTKASPAATSETTKKQSK